MPSIIQTIETDRGRIIIREADISDAAQFRELRLDALQDRPTAFPAEYSVNAGQPLSFWEGRLKTSEIGTIFFAEGEYETQLIGMTGIRRGESPKTKHSANIWGVYVRPAWRSLRISDSLIGAGIGWAKSNDLNILKLGVGVASTSAVRCYQRCGFTIYGTEPRGMFYDGQYYNGYLMYRDIP
jgi:RimJ/RimL family protein N-acetyltransferase